LIAVFPFYSNKSLYLTPSTYTATDVCNISKSFFLYDLCGTLTSNAGLANNDSFFVFIKLFRCTSANFIEWNVLKRLDVLGFDLTWSSHINKLFILFLSFFF